MTADAYLQGLLVREAVDRSDNSPVRKVQEVLLPTLQAWAGQYLANVHPSGSFMKGTANKSGTDIDIFVSLSHELAMPLKDVCNRLFNALTKAGYTPRRQNVSIGIRVGGVDVDIVPAKRQAATGGTIAFTVAKPTHGQKLMSLSILFWLAVPAAWAR